jgi:predicted enzyme related to lactoylglutathione lyase
MSTTAQQEVTAPANVTTGNFVWHELRTTDAKEAEDFYTHVVGWQAKNSGDPGGIPYTLLSVGDIGTAGLMQLTPDMLAGGMRPGWVGFIGVDDVDAYAKRIEQAGGHPNRGSLCLCGRPTGRGLPLVQGLA